MKRIIKEAGAVVLICFSILFFSFGEKAQGQEKQNKTKMEKTEANVEDLQLRVEGMSCQAGCANGIDNMLKQQDGIVKPKPLLIPVLLKSDMIRAKFQKRKLPA